MPSTGNVFPGTGENNTGIGATAWTNPGNIVSDNATDATCNAAASSQYLVARNFGFAIPSGATITGITVRIEATESSSGTETLNARLQNDLAALIGTGKTVSLNGTAAAVYTYGANSDVWGATLTPAIVNHANFGVRFWFTTAHNVTVDFVTLAVEYTLPTFTGSGSRTLGAVTGVGVATFTRPVYHGSGGDTLGAVTGSGTATFSGPAFTGSGGDTLGAVVGGGTAFFTAPAFTGSGSPTTGAVTGSGAALFFPPIILPGETFTGSGSRTLGAVTGGGSAQFSPPVFTGSGSPTLGAVTGGGSATAAGVPFTGSGGDTLGAVTGAGAATFTAPESPPEEPAAAPDDDLFAFVVLANSGASMQLTRDVATPALPGSYAVVALATSQVTAALAPSSPTVSLPASQAEVD